MHRYYPVGFDLTNIQYPGFLHLKEILKQRQNQIVSNSLPTNVKSFEEKLVDKFEGHSVSTNYPQPVPNYSFTIDLANKDYGTLQHIRRFTIKISLLVNYYTYFYVNYVKHKDSNALTKVLSLEDQVEENKERDLEIISRLLSEHFPNYYFIPHDLLFRLKIRTGIPFDDEYVAITEDRPVFAYLFESEMAYVAVHFGR